MGDQVYKVLNEIGHCSIRSPRTARTSHLQDLENFPHNSRVGTCQLGDVQLSTVQVLYPFTVERTVDHILYMSMITRLEIGITDRPWNIRNLEQQILPIGKYCTSDLILYCVRLDY